MPEVPLQVPRGQKQSRHEPDSLFFPNSVGASPLPLNPKVCNHFASTMLTICRELSTHLVLLALLASVATASFVVEINNETRTYTIAPEWFDSTVPFDQDLHGIIATFSAANLSGVH